MNAKPFAPVSTSNWISIRYYLDTYSKALTFPTQQFLQIQFAKGDILA